MALNKEEQQERDWGNLTIEELEREGALELPDREALSAIAPRFPIDPSVLTSFQTDGPGEGQEIASETPPETPER